MIKRISTIFLLSILLSCSVSSRFTEESDSYDYNQNIVNLVFPDSGISLRASLYKEKQAPINPKSGKMYAWSAYGRIFYTQGGYEGRLLDGYYVSYYLENKSLKEKGVYIKGLKSGKWLTWYPNGHLKTQETWKHGIKQGQFACYAANGSLTVKGQYKNNCLNGKINEFKNDSIIKTTYYKMGVKLPSQK